MKDNVLECAYNLNTEFPFLPVEVITSAAKKCKGLGAHGFFVTSEKKRVPPEDKEVIIPTFHFVKKAPYEEVEEKREAMSPFLDEMFCANVVARLTPSIYKEWPKTKVKWYKARPKKVKDAQMTEAR